jgi:hypothetical protein
MQERFNFGEDFKEYPVITPTVQVEEVSIEQVEQIPGQLSFFILDRFVDVK